MSFLSKKPFRGIINRLSVRRRLQLGGKLSAAALQAQNLARSLVVPIYPELAGESYYSDLLKLHRKIREELSKQKLEYPHYIYELGYPYQALHTLGIFGVRSTETRFDDYGLAELITRDDRILDIGCNCGFMLIYTSFRTGCSGDGMDINPYMINIGKHVVEYLKLSQRVNLYPQRFQDFVPQGKYSVVFSFASHWTDDEQLRPDFDEYMQKLCDLLSGNGILVFESHTADVNNSEFYEKMERQRKLFSWSGSKILYNGQRELFIMYRK